MVLFGATGDLAKRLVMPALYNLSRTKLLPEKFALIGVGRTKETAGSWGDHLYDMLKALSATPLRRSISTTLTRLCGSGLRRECRMSRAT
jgi:glucose-6-phosphate 1-dehydrogenase